MAGDGDGGDQLTIIVGAGPSGLSTAACLNKLSLPYILLEREDCFASVWKKYSYDRLHLHLAKQFCELPFMQFPEAYPTYVSRNEFLRYFLSFFFFYFQLQNVIRNSEHNLVNITNYY